MDARRPTRRRFLASVVAATALTPFLTIACQQQSPAGPTTAAQPDTTTASTTSGTPAAAAAPQSSEKVELQWYQYSIWNGVTGREADGKPDDYIQAQAAQFNKLHPNVTVKAFNFPQDLGAKIDTSLAAGKPIATTFTQGNGIARYGLLGVLSPVDSYIDKDDIADYLPGTYDEMSLAGKHYGYPYRLSPGGGILINQDLFKERGVDDLLPGGKNPDSPLNHTWTIDEFLEAAKATTFSRSGGGQPDVFGTVLMGTEYTYQLDAFLLSYGAKFWNDDLTKTALNSDVGAEALTWLADLELTQKVAAPGTAGRNMQSSMTFFQDGRAGILPISIGHHWKEVEDGRANGKWAHPFTLWGGLPPNKPPVRPYVETNVYGYIVFLQKDKNLETWAHKLAQFLSDKDHDLLAAQNGYPPVRHSLLDAIKDDYIMQVATDVGTNYFHTFGKIAQVAEPDPQLYQAVFSGKQNAKQALSDFEKRANKKLDEAYQKVDEAKKRGG